MTSPTRAPAAAHQTVYSKDDFVLYRDPKLFWEGNPNCTFICQVTSAWSDRTYDLVTLGVRRSFPNVDPTFMRLLPPTDVMHDIDTAPLSEPASEMVPAAVAWLRQHVRNHTAAPTHPELPPAQH
ncbi:hypothetical protein ACIP3A_39205 [Streptomyces tricolor]|uniref:hypothetical protein n=1 Tax=Streptomyces tricolor TaxID=68277 RepID=UPI0038167142